MKPNACLVFDSWAAYHGGKGANQAAAAAVLGAHPTLVGAVGSDPAGEEIASALKALGVDVSGVARVADTQTGLSAIFTMPDGAYVGTNVLGANGTHHPGHGRGRSGCATIRHGPDATGNAVGNRIPHARAGA